MVGVTGQIAAGKSFFVRHFFKNAPVFDADKIVHYLMAHDIELQRQLQNFFPDSFVNGVLNRSVLGRKVFADSTQRRLLEKLIHPLVFKEFEHFLQRQRYAGSHLVVLDVPLLFESGMQHYCDTTIAIWAPFFIRAQRLYKRNGSGKAMLRQIDKSHWSMVKKNQMADIVLSSGLGTSQTNKFWNKTFLEKNKHARYCAGYRNHRFITRSRAQNR
ncbi:MAG: dephospho-CoA kinase [Alphaproteobacteria bacterium]